MTNHVIDTHAPIWYITADSRLGPTAKKVLDAGKNGGNLTFVSTISLVEIIYLQEKGKIPSHVFTQVKYHHQRWWLEVMHLEGALVLS